jgi:hypothetical protein
VSLYIIDHCQGIPVWGNKNINKTSKEGDTVGVPETDYISHTFVWNQDAGLKKTDNLKKN